MNEQTISDNALIYSVNEQTISDNALIYSVNEQTKYLLFSFAVSCCMCHCGFFLLGFWVWGGGRGVGCGGVCNVQCGPIIAGVNILQN